MNKIDSQELHQHIDDLIQDNSTDNFHVSDSVAHAIDESHVSKIYQASKNPAISPEKKVRMHKAAFSFGVHSADMANDYMNHVNSGAEDIHLRSLRVALSTKGIDPNRALQTLKTKKEFIPDSHVDMPLSDLKHVASGLVDHFSDSEINYFIQDSLYNSQTQNSREDLDSHFEYLKNRVDQSSLAGFYANQENSPHHILTYLGDKIQESNQKNYLGKIFAHKNIPQSYVNQALKSGKKVSSHAFSNAIIPDEILDNVIRKGDDYAIENLSENDKVTKDQEARLAEAGYFIKTKDKSKLSEEERKSIFDRLPEEKKIEVARNHYKDPSLHEYMSNSSDIDIRHRATRSENPQILNKLLSDPDKDISLDAAKSEHLPHSLLGDHIKSNDFDTEYLSRLVTYRDHSPEWTEPVAEKLLSGSINPSDAGKRASRNLLRLGSVSGDTAKKLFDKFHKDDHVESFLASPDLADHIAINHTSRIIDDLGEGSLSSGDLAIAKISKKGAMRLINASPENGKLINAISNNGNLKFSDKLEIADRLKKDHDTLIPPFNSDNHFDYFRDAVSEMPADQSKEHIQDAIDVTKKHGEGVGFPWSSLIYLPNLTDEQARQARTNTPDWAQSYVYKEHKNHLNDEEIQELLSSKQHINSYFARNLKNLGLVADEPDDQFYKLNNRGKQHLFAAIDKMVAHGDFAGASDTLATHINYFDEMFKDQDVRSKALELLKLGANTFVPQESSELLRKVLYMAQSLPKEESKKLFNDIFDGHGSPHDAAYNMLSQKGGITNKNYHLIEDLAGSAPAGHPLINHLLESGVKLPLDLAMKHAASNPDVLNRFAKQESDPDKIHNLMRLAIDMHNNDAMSIKDITNSFSSKRFATHSPEDMAKLADTIISNVKDHKSSASILNHVFGIRRDKSDSYESEILDATRKFAEKHPSKLSSAAKIISTIKTEASNKVISNLIDSSLDSGNVSEAVKMMDMLDEDSLSRDTQIRAVKSLDGLLSSKSKKAIKDALDISSKLTNADAWGDALSKLHKSGKASSAQLASFIGKFPNSLSQKAFNASLHVMSSPDFALIPAAEKFDASMKVLSSNMSAKASPKEFEQLSNIFKSMDFGYQVINHINPDLSVKLINDTPTIGHTIAIAHSGYTKFTPSEFGFLADKLSQQLKPDENFGWYKALEPFLKQDPENIDNTGDYLRKVIDPLFNNLELPEIQRYFDGAHEGKLNSGVMDEIASRLVDKIDSESFSSHNSELFDYLMVGSDSTKNKETATKLFAHFINNFKKNEQFSFLHGNLRNMKSQGQFDLPNSDDLWESATKHNPDNKHLNLAISERFKLSSKSHEKMARSPGGVFLLSYQSIHPDNFPSLDESLDLSNLSFLDSYNVFSALDNIVSKMQDQHRGLVGDKYVKWLNEGFSHNSSLGYRGIEISGIAPHLSDEQIQKIDCQDVLSEVLFSGGGSYKLQSMYYKNNPETWHNLNKFKSSPDLFDFIEQNYNRIPITALSKCIREGKVTEQGLDKIFADESFMQVSASRLDEKIISSPRLTERQFNMLEPYFPISQLNLAGVFPVKEGWSPVFNNITHGLKKFLDINATVPSQIKKLGIKPESAIQSVNVSTSHKDLQNLSSLIPPNGISWADFKKQNPTLASSHHVNKLFVSAPKQFVTPDILNKAIAAGADSYKVTYSSWSGSQRHITDNPNLVIQINANQKLQEELAKDFDLRDVYQYITESARASSHPVTPFIVGWARVDVSNPDSWLIEETQSDFSAALRKEIEKLKTDGHNSIDLYGKQMPLSDFANHARKIQSLTSSWLDAIHQAVNDMAKKQGVEKLYMHGPDTRATLSNMNQEKYPEWLNYMYVKYPPQNKWEKANYNNLPNASKSFAESVKKRKFGYRSLQIWKKLVT